MATTTLITTRQAAEVLGKSERTVQRMATSGQLPYVQRLAGPTGVYLFDPDVVHELARELSIRAARKAG